MKTSSRLLLLSTLTFFSVRSYSQEYDDLYFTKKDRKAFKALNVSEVVSEDRKAPSFLSRQFSENYSTHAVRPKAIEKYKRANIDSYQGEEEIINNPNYSMQEEAYQDPVIVNNYYSVDPRRYNPYWSRLSFGSRWSNWSPDPWGSYGGAFGNLWNDPFYGQGSYYSPFGGFYNSYWCPSPFAGNSFAGVGSYTGFYGSYYRPVIVNTASERGGRTVERGPRNSRGGTMSSSGRSRQPRSVSVAGQTNDARDFTHTQAEYLNKSRKNTQISTVRTGRTSHSTRSTISNTRRSSKAIHSGVNSRSRSTVRPPAQSRPSNQRSFTPSINRSRSLHPRNVRPSSPSRSRNSGSVRPSSSPRSNSSGRSSNTRPRRGN